MVGVTYQHKAETALKRADELIAVGQKNIAYQNLHDMIMNSKKQMKSASYTSLEPIALKYVELSVELRRSKAIKEALHQYKNVCVNVNVLTLETVLRRLLDLAELKVNEAQRKAEELALDAVEDLEAAETPESVMLSYVSSEDTKDRTDRSVVLPWLRFLWETYRIALDILKLNARLEPMYQSVAQSAFRFCLKYNRKNEFRKLCETLRNHLALVGKSQKIYQIDLNDPQSLQSHLDTRFSQLNISIELELWQEAFRTIEDIHGLVIISPKTPPPQMIAVYYEKLAQIFAVAENYLFHAATYLRYFTILRTYSPQLPKSQYQHICSMVVLSILAVPLTSRMEIEELPAYLEFDEMTNKRRRLAALLGLTTVPNRANLLQDLSNKSYIIDGAHPEIKKLYRALEMEFRPLSVCSELENVMKLLSNTPEFVRYIRPLQEVLLDRLLRQLSLAYRRVRIDFLANLVSFVRPQDIEKWIVEAARRGELQVRADHQLRCIVFENDSIPLAPAGAESMYKKKVHPLTQLSIQMHLALQKIDHLRRTEERAETRRLTFDRLKTGLSEEHRQVLARKAVIERNKEIMERLLAQKQREEARERAARLHRQQELEKHRLEDESRKRESERIRREQEEIKRMEALRLAEEMKRKSEAVGMKLELDSLEGLDTQQLMAKQVEQFEAEKREMQARLRVLAKRLDYIERAYRKEELPLLDQNYETQKLVHREAHERYTKELLEKNRNLHQQQVAIRSRLSRMWDQYNSYKQKLDSRNRETLEGLRSTADEAYEQEKRQLFERLRTAKLDELRCRRIREIEEQRLLYEQELLEKEKQEKLTREKAEYEARRRRLDEQAELQRRRERDIEEKLSVSRESFKPTTAPPVSREDSWRQPATSAPAPTPAAEASETSTTEATAKKYVPPAMRRQQQS